jgi:hypothetical protein
MSHLNSSLCIFKLLETKFHYAPCLKFIVNHLPEFYIWKKKYENGWKNTFSLKFIVNLLLEFYIWKKKYENGGKNTFSLKFMVNHLPEFYIWKKKMWKWGRIHIFFSTIKYASFRKACVSGITRIVDLPKKALLQEAGSSRQD